MTIHVSKDLERFIHEAVRAGRYASESDVVNDALERLRRAMPEDAATPSKQAKRIKRGSRSKNLARRRNSNSICWTSGS
jgi:putative addiction module CopG family antidote